MKIDQKEGSTTGAMLLISGCCIGAGMLGLPMMSAAAGFVPSLGMFLMSWLFMTATALLLLEVNLWYSDEVSLISMAGRTLGTVGKIASWTLFIFLFYAIGVAYISGSGELLVSFVNGAFGTALPNGVGGLVVSLFFGLFVYLGTKAVDLFNRTLMIGLIVTYMLLVILGAPHVSPSNLGYCNWLAAPLVLPILLISFGFHNMIPSLKTYLNGDARRLRLAIICGSALPLVIYIIWEWLILGLISMGGGEGLEALASEGEMATDALKMAAGASWIVDVAQYFAFFAILTSFLGNSLSFVDFLADGFRVKKDKMSKLLLCVLVIAPPLLMSVMYPHLFLTALNYAGAFGAVTLFGIMPALMAWSGRYWKKIQAPRMLPGGKGVLAAIIVFALSVIVLQIGVIIFEI